MKVFRPTWIGKANTAAQIVTVPLVLISKITEASWARPAMLLGIGATIALTTISGVHYVLRLALNLRSAGNKVEQE